MNWDQFIPKCQSCDKLLGINEIFGLEISGALWSGCKQCWDDLSVLMDAGVILSMKNREIIYKVPGTAWCHSSVNDLVSTILHEIRRRKLLYSNCVSTVQASESAKPSSEKVSYMKIVFDDGKPFSDKEESGDGTVRKAGFEVREGSRVLARCEMAVVDRDDEDSVLAFAIGPTKDTIGVDLTRTEEMTGEVALAFCELAAAAYDILASSNTSRRRSGDGVASIDIDF